MATPPTDGVRGRVGTVGRMRPSWSLANTDLGEQIWRQSPCDPARVHVACGRVTGTYEQTTSIYESRTGLVESGGGGSRGRYGNICCVIEWSALGEGVDVWTLDAGFTDSSRP